MSKVEALMRVASSINEHPSAKNADIASSAGVSEQYLKMCKAEIKKLSPYLWKLLLERNEIDFLMSKLNASYGYEKGIISKLRKVYHEEKDGLIRIGTPDDNSSNECLNIGLCVEKGDNSQVDFWLKYLLYDVLFRIDSQDEADYRLAESCEAVDGYSKWRVKLRDNLYWSDGKPLTYEDLIYTISNSTIAKVIQEIKGDERETIFTLFQDNVLFPRWLSSVPILPSHSPVYEVTNGPFSLRKGKSLVNYHLYKNRNYHRSEYPKIGYVNLRTFTRPQFAIKAIEKGKLDVFFPLSLHDVYQSSTIPTQRLHFNDLSYWILLINKKSDYMKGKNRFRQLQKSIDYNAIDGYLSGTKYQEPTRFQSGSKAGIRVGYLCDMLSLEYSSLFKYMSNSLGVFVSYIIDVANYPADAIKSTTDVVIMQLFFGHGYSRLRQYFHSNGENNTFRFSHSDVDALIDTLNVTVSIDERKSLGQQIIDKLIGYEEIILLAPSSDYIFSNLYLEPSPKISLIIDFIVNLSNIVIERGTKKKRL